MLDTDVVTLLENELVMEPGLCLDAGARLRERIETRQARVAVIGLGYVGLPLALACAEAGFHTLGLEIQAEKVGMLKSGVSPIKDVPASEVSAAVRSGRFQ